MPEEESKIAVLQDAREYNAYLDREHEWEETVAPVVPPEGGDPETEEGTEGGAEGEGGEGGGVKESVSKVLGNFVLGGELRRLTKQLTVPTPPPVTPDDVAEVACITGLGRG